MVRSGGRCQSAGGSERVASTKLCCIRGSAGTIVSVAGADFAVSPGGVSAGLAPECAGSHPPTRAAPRNAATQTQHVTQAHPVARITILFSCKPTFSLVRGQAILVKSAIVVNWDWHRFPSRTAAEKRIGVTFTADEC